MKEKNFEEQPISYFHTLFEMVALWIGYINGCVYEQHQMRDRHRNTNTQLKQQQQQQQWACWNKYPQKRGSQLNHTNIYCNLGRANGEEKPQALQQRKWEERPSSHAYAEQWAVSTMKTMLYYKTLKSGNIFWSATHSLTLSLSPRPIR